MNYLQLDRAQFNFKEGIIAGDECVLITPSDMATKWNDNNKRYRSCIVRKSDGFIVSMGFGKFVNWGERPDFEPWNEAWSINARHKLDGSLLIISKYKGQLITRTRGTFDARQLENGHEIDLLIQKYPKVFDNVYLKDDWENGVSILCEWTTPNNIICLREHCEPTLTLIGAVTHRGHMDENVPTYWGQDILDYIAKDWDIGRPQKFEYKSIAECINDVKAWKDKEGVVIFSPCGQILKKIKAEHYLKLHRLMSSVGSIGNLIGVYLQTESVPEVEVFYEYLKTTLDFEIAEKCREDIIRICAAHKKVQEKQQKCRDLIERIKGLSRKEQALDIVQHYSDWRRPYCFNLLDGRDMDDKSLEKAILHYCENVN